MAGCNLTLCRSDRQFAERAFLNILAASVRHRAMPGTRHRSNTEDFERSLYRHFKLSVCIRILRRRGQELARVNGVLSQQNYDEYVHRKPVVISPLCTRARAAEHMEGGCCKSVSPNEEVQETTQRCTIRVGRGEGGDKCLVLLTQQNRTTKGVRAGSRVILINAVCDVNLCNWPQWNPHSGGRLVHTTTNRGDRAIVIDPSVQKCRIVAGLDPVPPHDSTWIQNRGSVEPGKTNFDQELK